MEYIEEEMMVTAHAIDNPTWHLDRINQHNLPLDDDLGIVGTGEGIDIYILDTG